MSLKTLASGLVLVFAVIFTGVEYITFAIINSPSVNESVLRSLIYFIGPLMVIPVAIKINSGRTETEVAENSIDNPTVSCMGEGCWKRFALEESTYAPLPNPDDITRVNVYRTCPYCVKGDTIILGDNKPISEITPNSTVVGKDGLTQTVQTFRRPYDGEMIKFHAPGLIPFEVTPEHPLLVATRRSLTGKLPHRWALEWKEARNIITTRESHGGFGRGCDYLVLPKVEGNVEIQSVNLATFTNEHGYKTLLGRNPNIRLEFPLNTETAWLLGLYVAEGSNGIKQVNFSLSKDEVDLQTRIREIAKSLGYSICTFNFNSENGTCVGVNSRVLARAFESWCGSGASNKKIPDFIMYHRNSSLLRAFLDGYASGDGSISIDRLKKRARRTLRMNTVSRVLAHQLQLAYARLGMYALLCQTRKKGVGQILGRKVKLNSMFNCIIIFDRAKTLYKELPDKYLIPIRRIETTHYQGEVFNIETTDNTYLISNIVSHNCGVIIPWIPSVTVRRDKWSQKLPAEVLQNVRRNG